MKEISVYKLNKNSANLDQLPMKRDWMDETFDRHAYHCFPMSLANRLGWSISFPEDISFIWDGINDSTSDHVSVIKGERFVHPHRGNRTISFSTGLYFDSETNISLLTVPVPNQFIPGTQCITTVVSTSVLNSEFPIAWIINQPNIEITIPANTPIAAILPISIKDIESHEIIMKNGTPQKWQSVEWHRYMMDRSAISQEKNSKGDWTHFYRDATDHLGNAVGSHESKKVVLKISDEKNN